MKTLKLLSALFIAVLVSMTAVSCGDDEEENGNNEAKVPAQLKGQWTMSTDDFETFKSMMTAIQEQEAAEDDDDNEARMMLKFLAEVDDLRLEFTDDNYYAIMHINNDFLTMVMGFDTDAEYIAFPGIEDKGDRLVIKPSSKTAGKIYIRFIASDGPDGAKYGEDLAVEYSNLTDNSVDIIVYADENEPTFHATLTKANKKVSYVKVGDLDWSEYFGDDDDDWGDDDEW